MADNENKKTMSRRRFVKNSGYVAGGVVGGGLLGSLLDVNWGDSDQDSTVTTKKENYNQALMYFTKTHDFDTLGAATERIFPEDDNGPGAIELGVPYFIDHQLAGGYGHNDRTYMQGPFKEGSPFQGNQSPLKRHEIFMEGIHALDKESNHQHKENFKDLDGEGQDKILQKMEKGEVKLKGVTSSYFFNLLHDATLSGAYADPLYGGNSNMDGWRMKEFPGHQMAYINDIEKEEFVKMEPNALGGQS